MDARTETRREIWSIIEAKGRANPQSLALHNHDVTVTYADLLDRTEHLASRIAECWSGQIAGLLIDDPIDRLLAMLATLRLGRGYCVIPSRDNPDWVANLRGTLECPLLVSDSSRGSEAAFVRAGTSVIGLTPRHASARISMVRANAPISARLNENVAAVYFTSGATGKPKLIRRTEVQIATRVKLYSQECGFTRSDRFALMTHPGFVAAEGDIYGCLLNGGALYLVDPNELSFDEFSQWVKRNRISVLHPPVPYFQKWVRTWKTDERFPQLRCVLLGGAGVPAEMVQGIWDHLAPNTLVHHRYSSTEAGPVARFALRAGGPKVSGPYLPIGIPFSFVDWKLTSEGGDSSLEGELLVKSTCLSEDAPRDGQGYYHTGDWVRATTGGELTFLGRRDGIVKVRGYRVHLDGLSHTLAQQPGIDDARVVACSDGSAQTRLVGFVVTAECELSETAIRNSLKKVLPLWQVPARIVILEKIPETLSGKHDVAGLMRYLECEYQADSLSAAADIQLQLENLWRAESRWVGAIDRNRALLEHGGDSLMALGFLSRVERTLAVNLTQLDFIRNPSVNQLANRVRKKLLAIDASQDDSLLISPINREGYPPIVCVPWAGEPMIGDLAIGKELDGQRTLYWLYPRGFDGKAMPLRTIDEQVEYYSDVIRNRFGDEPLVLCGFSLGGVLAYSLATTGNLNVDQLVLLDTQMLATHEFQNSLAGPRRRWLSRRKLDMQTLRFRLIAWYTRRSGKPFPMSIRNDYFRCLNLKARRLFKPQPYSGSVHFIGSNGFEGEGIEARVRPWRTLCQDLTVSHVDTNHVGLFGYPHLRDTARLIVTSAAKADAPVHYAARPMRDAA